MNFENRYISANITITGQTSSQVVGVNNDPEKKQLYIDAKIDMLGMGSGKAYVRIFGLAQETMRLCTIVNPQSALFLGNRLELLINGKRLFNGEIFRSVPNYTEYPNLSLDIECYLDPLGVTNRTESKEPVIYPPEGVNYKERSIHQALGFIAIQLCGYNQGRDVFEDERAQGREYSLDGASCLFRRTSEPLPYRLYLVGTPRESLQSFCKNFGIQYVLRNNNNGGKDLYYWPIGKLIPRKENSRGFWPISAEKGNLFGYPEATINGVKLKCEFNDGMQVGDGITLTTMVPGLTGVYSISKLEGYISTREGKWEADLEAVRYA